PVGWDNVAGEGSSNTIGRGARRDRVIDGEQTALGIPVLAEIAVREGLRGDIEIDGRVRDRSAALISEPPECLVLAVVQLGNNERGSRVGPELVTAQVRRLGVVIRARAVLASGLTAVRRERRSVV